MTDQCPACVDGTCLECDGEGCGICNQGGDCPDCDGTGLNGDPHAGCYQPHRGPDGDYHDCDGRPI